MTEILISRNKAREITGFTVSGHALFDKAGNDIVCAAISMLTINTLNSIEEFLPDDKMIINIDREEGKIEARLHEKPSEGCTLLLNAFHLGMVSLEEQYGRKYVRVLES